jgi:sulfate permease, SulP family
MDKFSPRLKNLFDINQFRPPILQTLAQYDPQKWSGDWRAGINVALLAIPQGMAYALVAGLPISYGLLGSAIAAIIGGIFGGGRFVTLGPTNATAVLLFGVFASIGLIKSNGMGSEESLSLLPWILVFTSVFLIIASILRISFMIQFISRTVITAYVTAAACLIIANQSKHLLGLQNTSGDIPTTFWEIIIHTLSNLNLFSLPALLLSLLTAFFYVLLQRKFPSLPNVAITLVISSLIAVGYEQINWRVTCLDSFSLAGSFLTIPKVSTFATQWETILSSAFAVSLLCLLEGLSIGKSLAARAGSRINTNQETMSIGLGNLGCALFSGMPASGSLTRSTLNVESGATTSVANLVAGLLILLGSLVLGNLIAFVPLCALATLVVFIGTSLIKARQIKTVSRATGSDAVTFIVTITVGLLFSLQVAIFAGMITSIILFLKKVAEPELREYGFNEEGELAEMSLKSKRPEPEVSIVHVEGELFFAAAELFYEQIRRVGDDENLRVLVLKLLNAHHLDATSVLALEELLEYLKEKNCHVLLCEVRRDALRILKNSGVLERINRKNVFPHTASNPTLSTAKAIKRAKFLVDGEKAKVTIFADSQKKL